MISSLDLFYLFAYKEAHSPTCNIWVCVSASFLLSSGLDCKVGYAHWPLCISVQMTLAPPAPYYPQPLDILIDISLSAPVLKATTFHFIFAWCWLIQDCMPQKAGRTPLLRHLWPKTVKNHAEERKSSVRKLKGLNTL